TRENVMPHTRDGVEEKKPGRGHQRLRLRQPGLRAPIFSQCLVRTFMPLRVSELDQGFDRTARYAQSHRAETRMEARRIRKLVSRIGQDERVGVERCIGGRYESILHDDIVTPRTAQS